MTCPGSSCAPAPRGQSLPKIQGRPGCISWYGKLWGNIGSVDGQAAIEVDSVMEGNWAWRKSLLASLEFDPELNFDDASMYGLDLCAQARRRGFKVIYEPRALVYHHAVSRAPELDRADRPRRIFAYCRNYTYIMLKQLSGWRKAAFLSWWFLVGERSAWGLGAIASESLSGRFAWRHELSRALAGKMEGIRLWLKS